MNYFAHCVWLLSSLSRGSRGGKAYSKRLDIIRWLQHEECTPDLTYLVSAPMYFPLIGLVQLAHYYVAFKTPAQGPGELREGLSSTTGYRQGIVSAVGVASASTWVSFHRITSDTRTILFWIGCRSQQTYPSPH